jgi:hypothetical protein
MTEIRESGWTHSLNEVERAVGACLDALDRYETAFAGLLFETGNGMQVANRLDANDDREWDQRLSAAQAHVDSIEQLLIDQQAIWTSWQQTYQHWRESLERTPVKRD